MLPYQIPSPMSVLINFYLSIITKRNQQEKPNMGLVKLKEMPAIDGYASRKTRRPRTPLVGWWRKRQQPVDGIHMDVSKNRGGWKPPQIIHFNRVFHYKLSILGYPNFWKHPYLEWTMSYLTHCCWIVVEKWAVIMNHRLMDTPWIYIYI